MSAPKPKYSPRGYQTYILDRISELRGTNVLLELDCGLGKRYITHQIVATRFPESKTLIVVHSSSSLAETVDYLKSEYGGLEEQLGELSSRIPSGQRLRELKEKRVIVATPQVLASVASSDIDLFQSFEILLINEVDTLVKRSGGASILIYPWSTILTLFKDKWLIGMSGTLRDDHAVFTDDQLEIRNELMTLKEHIPGAVVITMEELYGTDVEDFLEETFLGVNLVNDTRIKSLSMVIDELIRSTRAEIVKDLSESDNIRLVEGDSRRMHLLLDRLPITDELKGRYSSLLLLRKYVYAMPPKQFLKSFRGDYVKHYFDASEISRVLPTVSAKALRVLELAARCTKTVVLTSYLEMVEQVRDVLDKSGISVLTMTGGTRDKGEILKQFKEDKEQRVLVMSPVGERDLDIPQAELMVVCDTINTTKTMYQKFKRTRGGLVLLLAYAETSEERKVQRLMKSILEKYPWSTAVVESNHDK
jgi:superfamily II DNA or RNA helicase